MGEISIVMGDFLRNKERFADLFNGFFFGGHKIVRPEELQDASTWYARIFGKAKKSNGSRKSFERQRDIKMFMQSGTLLRILAIENQNKVDYAMPFRVMEFDCLEYHKQIKDLNRKNKETVAESSAEFISGLRKSDRLIPIYTICLYHGEEPWDGPRSLKDMMEFGDDADGMSQYFADYAFRLFCLNEIEEFDMLHTELREVFMALNCRRDKVKMRRLLQENEGYRHMDEESVYVLTTLLNQPQIWEEREKYLIETENSRVEEYDMCQAWREIKEEERLEGRLEGQEQAIVVITFIAKATKEGIELSDAMVAESCGCSAEYAGRVRKALEM